MTGARFGVQLWPQKTDWPALRDAAIAADDAGWDLIGTWDHLLAIVGPWEQPAFEGWSLLAALAAVTRRARLGLMVGANTFRNPGLTIADALRPYRALGFGTYLVRMPAPYDHETLDRIGEVTTRLDG